MKKELTIGILIGLIIGLVLGYFIFNGEAQVEEKYECPSVEAIDCMPVIPLEDTERAEQCGEPYHSWIKENCPSIAFAY